jgi:hypothetical protein
MPTTVTIDRARGIRVMAGTGMLRAPDFIDVNEKIRADPELFGLIRSMIDLREASLDELTAAEVHAVVNLPPLPRQAETRTAIVATAPVAFGMARMYSMLQESQRGGNVRVFDDYDEGLDWLLEPQG